VFFLEFVGNDKVAENGKVDLFDLPPPEREKNP